MDEVYISQAAAALQIPLAPEWLAPIAANLAISLAMATTVAAFPLEDDAEAAPVFQP